MGNRAVIATKDGWDSEGNNTIGVYLHWNGGRDSVEGFLHYCKLRGFRRPEEGNYGWARLTQVIANFFGGDLSIGVEKCSHLDCDNGDNGLYLIRDWEIVDRMFFGIEEQADYDFLQFMHEVDQRQPEFDQVGFARIKEYCETLKGDCGQNGD